MNRERVIKLRDELESGKWQKTVGRLHRIAEFAFEWRSAGHCCQGVACELALADNDRGFELNVNGARTSFNGLSSVWPFRVRDYFGFSDQQSKALLDLNDDYPDDKWSHVIAYLNDLLSAE